jgi:hypothetical protein
VPRLFSAQAATVKPHLSAIIDSFIPTMETLAYDQRVSCGTYPITEGNGYSIATPPHM